MSDDISSTSKTKEEKENQRKHKREEDEVETDDNSDIQNKTEEEQQLDKFMTLSVYGEHRRAVSSVKLAPSRLTKTSRIVVASASADGTCKIWDISGTGGENDTDDGWMLMDPKKNPNAGEKRRSACTAPATCVGHTRGINEVSWNPVSPLLATASDDKTVRLWDAITAETLVELRGHDNFVFAVDQHVHMIATGSFDETVKLWDIRAAQCIATLPAHSDPVTAVSFNRDGTTVATASHDGLVRIWDVATSECLKTIYASGNPPVSFVKYSPNSKYLLAGTLDSTLRLWPVTVTGRGNMCTKSYRNPSVFVNTKFSIAADFLADGKHIVVGSENGDVILFDLQSSDVSQRLSAHDDAVLAVSAHDSCPILATGGMTADRRVEFWTTPRYIQQQQQQ